MRKIKLVNKISPSGLEILETAGYKCSEDIENPDGMIVRSASLHDVEIPSSVRAIARAGAGTNNIPVEKCSELGVVVFNTPGGNANAVKELTIMGLLLSARKSFPAMQWAQSIKGEGDKVPALVEKEKAKYTGPELKGKKLGVIGLGAIGVMVCNTASHFGMEIYGYDPFLSVDSAWKLSRAVHHAGSLKEIYETCDFITLHLPLTSETKGMINSQSIATMKAGVRILNFSRAELVVNEDIIGAVEDKQVYCYVTDFPTSELIGHNGIIALPHLGASTPESEDNCAEMAAAQLKEYLETGNIKNSVNMPEIQVGRSTCPRITVFHRNVPAMITQITAAVGKNISNFTNSSRGDYAYSLIDIDGDVSADILDKLKAIDGVIRVRDIK